MVKDADGIPQIRDRRPWTSKGYALARYQDSASWGLGYGTKYCYVSAGYLRTFCLHMHHVFIHSSLHQYCIRICTMFLYGSLHYYTFRYTKTCYARVNTPCCRIQITKGKGKHLAASIQEQQ